MAQVAQPNGMVRSLVRRVTTLLGAKPPRMAAIQLGPQAVKSLGKTTATDPNAARDGRASYMATIFGQDPWEQGRLSRYRDYREIVQEVPELATALTVRVDFTFGQKPSAAFNVRFAPTAREEVIRICKDADATADLQKLSRQMLKEGLQLGDSFVELIYDEDRMVAVKSLEADNVKVMVDDITKLLSHYEVTEDATEPRRLEPIQVIHFAHNPDKGKRYGISIYDSCRGLRRKHEALDDSAPILGLRKAAGETYWIWPMPPEGDDKTISKWISDALQSVSSESFFDARGHIRRRVAALLETIPKILPYRVVTTPNGTVIDTKPTPYETRPVNLDQAVNMLEHYQDRLFVATNTPKGLAGLERDVNSRSTLEQQGYHFSMTINGQVQDVVGIKKAVLVRACLAAGVVPEEGEFWIEEPEVSAFDQAMRAGVHEKRGAAILDLRRAGMPLRAAVKLVYEMDDDDLDEADIIALDFKVPGAVDGAVNEPAA